MTAHRAHLGLRYRLAFYLGGFLFASASYTLGVWAFGVESASWGDSNLYYDLLRNLVDSFQSHMISFFLWQAICISISGIIGHLFDDEVKHRRVAEARANIDGLTEIYNHRFFQEKLEEETERALRYARPFSLIIFDLDCFKNFNDTWGHQEGDRILKWFADLCSTSIRNIDTLARYGGEEFVIILPETGDRAAVDVAERIRKTAQKQSTAVFGKNKGITVSAGVACYPDHGTTNRALIVNADTALYSAKQKGRNRVCLYDHSVKHIVCPDVNHVARFLRDDSLKALEALAQFADARDGYTQGHSKSVMELSGMLGEALKLSAEEISNLKAAALLHDIGRIGTPDEIIGKRPPLKHDEWKVMENHAKLGSQIIKQLQQMQAVIPGVQYHHERFDGKGYPNGLSGENIPLFARVIAIADAYDALTNTRSYREAMTHGAAIDELNRGAGGQFDPELVELFIAILDRKRKSEAA